MAAKEIKFSVFADLHHYPGVFCTHALERLRKIQARAMAEKVDCIIELGDFCHRPNESADILSEFERFSIPGFHVLGNHDTDGASLADTLKCYHMTKEYYFFDLNGFRFIVLDTNYYRWRDSYTHFEYRNYFDFPGSRETLPPEQLDWLRETLFSASGPCILLSHASIERESGGGVVNRDEVLSLVREANKKERRVMLAINGHHHRDFLRLLEGVAYLDLNSASFEWLSHPHDLYPEELRREYEMVDHMIIYNDPVHAVITLSDDGRIKIEGMQSSFLHGISKEMTPNPRCDNAGRPCTAKVLSAEFSLW